METTRGFDGSNPGWGKGSRDHTDQDGSPGRGKGHGQGQGKAGQIRIDPARKSAAIA